MCAKDSSSEGMTELLLSGKISDDLLFVVLAIVFDGGGAAGLLTLSGLEVGFGGGRAAG
ncbi:hypothetical protein CCP3SC15_120030 [Gammaproteobacteria bacterium]